MAQVINAERDSAPSSAALSVSVSNCDDWTMLSNKVEISSLQKKVVATQLDPVF